MVAKACSDEQFIQLFETLGPAQTAKFLNITERNVFRRRKTLESYGTHLVSPNSVNHNHSARVEVEVKNGVVIIGSDFHIWPGDEPTCLRAFKKFCKDLKPSLVILNGDVLDFPQISRHPPIGWEGFPELVQEIEAAQDHLTDIVQVLPRNCKRIWTLGNHDQRMETRIASVAREMRGLNGMHLHDHFPLWDRGWSCYINGQHEAGRTMVKHRLKSGPNAPRMNAVNAGVSVVTGHLHSQKVSPLSDYHPYDRYGVDAGCIADKAHKAFNYCEDNPLDWRSGFAILTYRDYRLMYPELVSKWSATHVQWRGSLIRV